MKVIILSKSNYKEKDCIYSAISYEGYLSFLAKGAQDPKSKYVWLNNQFTIAEVEFLADGRYKHKVINSAVLISSPLVGLSYEYLVATNVLLELARNVLEDDEKHLLFNDIELALNAFRNEKDRLMTILVFMAKLIKLSGTEFEVEKCVICGSKQNIKAFSFDEGGFVCGNCLNDEIKKDLNAKQMLLIRYIFKAKDYSLPGSEEYSDTDKKVILMKLTDFIDNYLGVKLNSIETLLK